MIQYIDAKASPVGNVTLDRIFGDPPCPHYHGWVPTAEERAGIIGPYYRIHLCEVGAAA